MIDPITKYRLQEGYLLSDKTISVNLKDFVSRKNNKLIIVGVMGSGKTTIGEKLAKKWKVKWYSIDSFWWRLKQKHFKDKPDYQSLSEKEKEQLNKLFEIEVFKILKSNNRAIIEGINLIESQYRKLILKQSMIILGVSSILAGIRAGKRNMDRGDDDGTWRLLYWMAIENMKSIEPIINKLRKEVKSIPNMDIQEYKI